MTGHVPDVLETIAQIAADDVYTPPKIANAVLDLLPTEVWTSHPEYRWLDPGCKSGVFLREAYRRLMIGLSVIYPDAQERREHILKNMLFAEPTTALNGLMTRRSLYQTTDATGANILDLGLKKLHVKFENKQGNASFIETQHNLDKNGKACVSCKAPASLIRSRRENFAYSFIHNIDSRADVAEMKFDVIVGNPPYQIGMEDADGNKVANITPLYNLFVEQAIALEPKYIAMITPSRWFGGGKGLSSFRAKMIKDRRLRFITDIPDATEVFPTVEIKGGVSYFLWDRDWNGDCTFSTFQNGRIQASQKLHLGKYGDVILRDIFGSKIVDKILQSVHYRDGLHNVVSFRDPFGQSLTSNFKDFKEEPFTNSIPLIFNSKVGYVESKQLERNHDWVDKWKVIIPKASDGSSRESATVLGEPIALAPGSACTQSYLVAGTFDSKKETENYARYLTTKFCRFLVLQKKMTQNMTGAMFSFVPVLDWTQTWDDKALFELFGLTNEEIAYIERLVGGRGWIDNLHSSIPETHLPGGRKYKANQDETADEEQLDE
jgi:site-specific DNA-methyltransferase (adenine-specific)